MLRTALDNTVVKRGLISSISKVSVPALTVLGRGGPKRGYHENIVEHYENPRNVGSLDKNDDNVGTVSTRESYINYYADIILVLHSYYLVLKK